MVHPDGIAWIEPFSIGLLNFSIKRLFGSPLLYYFVVFSIGVYLGILLWNKTFQRHKETIYFVGLIGIPVLLVSIVSLAVSIIDSRYLSPLVVPITLLFGLSLIHILKRRQLILSLVFILLLVAEGVIILTTPTLFYDINWYKVEDKITTQLVDNPSIDTIVYAPRNMNLVLGYYLSDAADSLSREINLVGFNALESIQKYDFNLNKTRSLMYVDTTYGSEKLQDDILSHLRTTYDEYAVTSIGRVNIYLFRSE
jgi:4-amino-4-deoxy-L-arabinose transferase-like glycosyltransferase